MVDEPYSATRESLARHRVPPWWQDAKFGVLITWGPYAVPAFAEPTDSFFAFSEWYWFFQQLAPGELHDALPQQASDGGRSPDGLHRDYHRDAFGANVTYDDLLDRWRAEKWDPQDWIDLIERSGAGYFVLVAKHHDGVALWPTATSGRNSVDLGPRRDVVGELMRAAEASPLHTGLFYAMAEWFNPAPHPRVMADQNDPLFDLAFNRQRRAADRDTGESVGYRGYRPVSDYARGHVVPQIEELIHDYEPSILWFDLPGDSEYYKADRLIADFYNSAEERETDGVLVNDRASADAHGDFHSYEYGLHPRDTSGERPFEACRSIGTSFGYNAREEDDDYASSAELIETLVEVVADGGNLLLNIGPRADGTIDPRQSDRLREIGRWLETNGVAIRGSRPWPGAPKGPIRFTVGADGCLYGFLPAQAMDSKTIDLPVRIIAGTTVEYLDSPPLNWERRDHGTRVSVAAASQSDAVPGAPRVIRLGLATDALGTPSQR
ncbi:alpha-L-fucosidase [Cryobacterium sp. SO2]|uniref:alpha-L-fucosidase n=1 Tax=Cryobacterium sp. SO2 TaxID=1897060 RepID=UPI00223CAE68|nr:alpha-L-fucosidase [Cryobacterium sp. SO2]WEO77300.1 alpha-L-fucosidase [Cryobacterium sp. SO2]